MTTLHTGKRKGKELMQYHLSIDMDKDAFSEAPFDELSRILEELAKEIKQKGQDSQFPRDSNGNVVGYHLFIEGRNYG